MFVGEMNEQVSEWTDLELEEILMWWKKQGL